MSREFVTVAEEVHFLYPEGEWALKQAKDDPRHIFFKTYGESVPEKDWNHPGTKQGVYMIGPNSEYLQGAHQISGNVDEVRERLKEALENWNKLRREKKYANKDVPQIANIIPPEMNGKSLVFRVYLRDLPRGRKDDSGRRFQKSDFRGGFLSFTNWAWNVNWLSFDDPKVFVPKGIKEQPVDDDAVSRLCRLVLVDNVRGQTPVWEPDHLKSAQLLMKHEKNERGLWVIEYRGEADLDSGNQSYKPKLYGRALWDPKKKRFESFDLLSIGDRSGQGTFNQRRNDLGPAPMGVGLVLYRPSSEAGD